MGIQEDQIIIDAVLAERQRLAETTERRIAVLEAKLRQAEIDLRNQRRRHEAELERVDASVAEAVARERALREALRYIVHREYTGASYIAQQALAANPAPRRGDGL